MANIGIIDIAVKASTNQLAKGLKTAQGLVGGAVSGFMNMASGANLLKAAVVGAAGALAGSWVASVIQGVDTTAEMAQKLGMTTESLISLRYAAKLTGSDTDALDAGMMKMNQNLGKAAIAGGPVEAMLAQMGLNSQALIQMTPEQAFLKISGAMVQMQNPALQAAAAVTIFGKGGSELLNTLRAGPEVIGAFTNEAIKAGLALNSVDAAKVSSAQDQIDKIGIILGGIQTQIVVQLAPFIEFLGAKFTEAAMSGQGMGAIVANAFKYVITGAGYLVDAIQVIKLAFLSVQTFATTAIATLLTGFGWLGKKVAEFINLFPGMNVSFGDTLTQMGEATQQLADTQFENLRKEMGKPWDDTAFLQNVGDLQTAATTKAQAAVAAMTPNRELDAGQLGIDPKNFKLAGAQQFGSSEAAKTILSSQFGGGEGGLLAENKKQSGIQEQMLTAMNAVASAVGGSLVPTSVGQALPLLGNVI